MKQASPTCLLVCRPVCLLVQVYTPDTMVETKKMAETVAINIIGRGKGVKEQHESCSWEVSQIIMPWNVA